MAYTKKQIEDFWARVDTANAQRGAEFNVGEQVFVDNGFKEYLVGEIVAIERATGRVSVLVSDASNGGVVYAHRKNPVEGTVVTRTPQDIKRTIEELG